MPKRYFEIDLSDEEYEIFLREAADEGLDPSGMLKFFITKKHPDTEINALTEYLITDTFNNSIRNLYEYFEMLENIEYTYHNIGKLYCEKMDGINNHYYEDELRDFREELNDLQSSRDEIWEELDIIDNRRRRYEEETATKEFINRFLDNIVDDDSDTNTEDKRQ